MSRRGSRARSGRRASGPRPGGPRPIALGRDEEGAFLVLEAILVALLVLTAILFFTNVQRPSTGAGEGGLDLAQVSADTLQILMLRSFSISGQTQTLDGWVLNATRGDAATLTVVDTFLGQVLPTGAHYSLRLDNGVSTLQILPSGAVETARNARAAEVAFLPRWAAFRNDTPSAAMRVVVPGQVVAATDPLVSGSTYSCYEAPYGSTASPTGEWSTRWKSAVQATTPTTNGKETAAVLGSMQQVPRDLPLGKWKLSPATVGGHCTGAATYVDVVPPGDRVLTVSTTTGERNVTAAAGSRLFSRSDVGLEVSGTGMPAGASITNVYSPSVARLSVAPTATNAAVSIRLPVDPTFMPYGLQLVVWFGA